jgi:bacterioferritin
MSHTAISAPETKAVVDTLNRILELELAGVVRYLHYSFMVFGHGRIPIVAWLRSQSDESRAHAIRAGELVTTMGAHPSLAIGSLLESHRHDVHEILEESLKHEQAGVAEYRQLYGLVSGRDIMLEEYARQQIAAEEEHIAEIRKMMRRPGSIL